MAEKNKNENNKEKKSEGITIEDMATFCKKKGFVFRSSDIYGGLSGFFDYGPLGVELFNNIKQNWWKHFVQSKENMVGLDSSMISHSKIWEASGHLDSFKDVMVTCSKCKNQVRADHLIEDELDINVEGKENKEINEIIQKNKLLCPKCKSNFEELKDFNLLFPVSVGAEEGKGNVAYLRGETAQGMFTDFKLIADTSRQKLPFGIAQVGRCFRNEIAPRDFIFRCREFTIGEFEFFIHPDEKKCDILTKKHLNLKLMFLDGETQDKGKKDLKETTIGGILKEKRLGEWHAYWLAEQIMWFYSLGLKKENIKIREHMKNELSHYSSATFDMDYMFPFGSQEIAGNANRGQYDLNQQIKGSNENLFIFDEESKQKVVPRVIEPTFGMDRAFLAVIVDAYNDDKKRGNIVLKLNPELAPIKVGVFPLVNKVGEKAREVFDKLKCCYPCIYDKGGSVGRRYARADEIGIPYCITIDFETLDDESVTLRDRDSTKQIRVKIDDLMNVIYSLLMGGKLEDQGKVIK
ncbi:glycine--tRNA ligase [Nanoarchaeota archaeon]